MVIGKRLRAVLAGTILLIIVTSLAVFLSTPRQTRPALQNTAPGIEEHHYITLIVKAPDNTTHTQTIETKSFVYIEAFILRAFSTWGIVGPQRDTVSQMTSSIRMNAVNGTGNPTNYYIYAIYDASRCIQTPSVVFLGSGTSQNRGQSLGSPLGVYAVPTVNYVYGNQWFNVTITATFSFSNAVTVSEAGLGVLASDNTDIIYAPLIYDDFPAISVPAGGSLTIQWVLAWKDNGAFTENWGKLWQYALTLDNGCLNQYVNFTDDTGTVVSIPWPNTRSDTAVALRLAWGTDTSPMSRSSYRLGQEKGSIQPSYARYGTGMAIGGAVSSQASEVGLYWLAVDNNGNPHRILLMRWVPGYTLPAGTPINIYIAKGG